MWILVGILAAGVLWWLLKLSLYTLFILAVIGAILGAIPLFRGRIR